AGITGLKRVESLNDDPIFINSMANIVKDHLEKVKSGNFFSNQYLLRCPKCKKDSCQKSRDFFKEQIFKI
ncbi:31024_t:CDS:1, partial [Racocetra persica]